MILKINYFIIYILLLSVSTVSANPSVQRPKLVLQITIDQLRGDLLTRYQQRYSNNGFNYLLNNGSVFNNVHHAHANTETIVGHVTLATGAYPSEHGLIGNMWFDQKTGKKIYNIEDSSYKLLSKNAAIDKKIEIDPTQKIASVDGRSPMNIQVSTFSDELVSATVGQAKVFAVSIKDRGAVSMAGQGGKAFWFSKKSKEFVTSNYYYDKYPAWVTNWNSKKYADKYQNTQWTLLKPKKTYVLKNEDNNQWEMDLAGFGRTFPHNFGNSKYFSTLLTASPMGDELTAKFAIELLKQEKLGKDEVTDYLSISFSATDYIGHFFGTSSLETEDNLLRLDQTLSILFEEIDSKVGLKNTLIVLSADHGAPDTPGMLKKLKLKGSNIENINWENLPIIQKLKATYGLSQSDLLIRDYSHPYIYLNKKLIKHKNLSVKKIQNQIAQALITFPSIHTATASNKVISGQLKDTKLNRAISRNYYPGRSGDIYIVFQPQSFINKLDSLKVASMHGSPWSYDTFVPLIFVGENIKAQQVYRKIETVDIAPTLSALIKIKAPSVSQGNVLKELFTNEIE